MCIILLTLKKKFYQNVIGYKVLPHITIEEMDLWEIYTNDSKITKIAK